MKTQHKYNETSSNISEQSIGKIHGIHDEEISPEEVISIPQTKSIPDIPVPWGNVTDYVPKGYLITLCGVYIDKPDPELVSGPCWVEALTRSDKGFEWGLVLAWLDQDGNMQRKAFPANRLTDRGSSLASDLASLGLKVVPGKQSTLMAYLGSFDLPSDYRQQSVSKLGWLDSDQKNLVYVCPDKTIGLEQREIIIFQPEKHSTSVHTMHNRGSLEKWQTFVARLCKDSPVLMFALSAAVTGPLLKYAAMDSCGFHFFGTSSKGKTTALQVAASVWGNGADPAIADDSHVGRWNTTGNALEATAAAHNDGLLALDEIGTCDARNFEKVIYDLFGGRGKARLNKSSMLQAQRSWRVLGLSSGELSVRQKLQEENKQAKAGILNRMIDIPIHSGVFPEDSEMSPGERANALKKACGNFYGCAGPKFLESLVALEPDAQSLSQRIQEDLDIWQKDLIEDRVLESFQERTLRRFACVLQAGLLAIDFKLLPFEKSALIQAICSIRDVWLGCEDNSPESLQGLRLVKAFILKHQQARFGHNQNNSPNNPMIRDLAGYIDPTRKLILFTDDGLREACAGFNKKDVLHEAKKHGYLFINDQGRLKSKHTIGNHRISLYGFRMELIEDDV